MPATRLAARVASCELLVTWISIRLAVCLGGIAGRGGCSMCGTYPLPGGDDVSAITRQSKWWRLFRLKASPERQMNGAPGVRLVEPKPVLPVLRLRYYITV